MLPPVEPREITSFISLFFFTVFPASGVCDTIFPSSTTSESEYSMLSDITNPSSEASDLASSIVLFVKSGTTSSLALFK